MNQQPDYLQRESPSQQALMQMLLGRALKLTDDGADPRVRYHLALALEITTKVTEPIQESPARNLQ